MPDNEESKNDVISPNTDEQEREKIQEKKYSTTKRKICFFCIFAIVLLGVYYVTAQKTFDSETKMIEYMEGNWHNYSTEESFSFNIDGSLDWQCNDWSPVHVSKRNITYNFTDRQIKISSDDGASPTFMDLKGKFLYDSEGNKYEKQPLSFLTAEGMIQHVEGTWKSKYDTYVFNENGSVDCYFGEDDTNPIHYPSSSVEYSYKDRYINLYNPESYENECVQTFTLLDSELLGRGTYTFVGRGNKYIK